MQRYLYVLRSIFNEYHSDSESTVVFDKKFLSWLPSGSCDSKRASKRKNCHLINVCVCGNGNTPYCVHLRTYYIADCVLVFRKCGFSSMFHVVAATISIDYSCIQHENYLR